MNYITVKLRCCVGFFFSRFVFLIVVLFIVVWRWNGRSFFTLPKTIRIFSCRHGENFLISKQSSAILQCCRAHTHANTLLFKRHAIEVFFLCLATSLPNQLSIQFKQSIELCVKLNRFFFHSLPACRTYTQKI